MTLQQLGYFAAACRHGNITRAAEECGVSQPSISAAIKNLEQEFGLCLVRRRQTGFTLTKEGAELRRLAEALLEHADNVEKTMHARGKNRPFLRLGIPPMAATALFPAIYGEFCAQNEDLTLYTQEMGREDLLKALDGDLLDMAFLPHTEDFSVEYIAIPVTRFETVCCVAKGHLLAHRERISPAELAGEPLVLFSDRFFQTERILACFADAGVEPRVLHRSSQLSTVEQFIAEGIAVGFLFRETADKNKQLVSIPLEPRLYTKISLVMRRDRFVSEGMQRFSDYIEKAFTNW